MKKRIFWLLFFTLFVITCFSFSACTEVADLGIKDPSAADPDSGKDKNSVCTTHIDIDKNKKCDKCGVDFIGDCATHKDSDDDHKCDYCAFVIGECRDENVDGICDACGKILRDNSTPPCVDSNKDGACDDCGKKIDCVECIDRDKNAVCDNCGGRVECAACIDENYNGRCDVCSAKVEIKPHDCKDENEDYVCDLCEKKLSCQTLCIDENLDGVCDICKTDNHAVECIDANYNGICEICLATVEIKERPDCDECIDENFDDWCDNCGILVISAEDRSIWDIVPYIYTDEEILDMRHNGTRNVDAENIVDVPNSKIISYKFDYTSGRVVLASNYICNEQMTYEMSVYTTAIFLSESYLYSIGVTNGELFSLSSLADPLSAPTKSVVDFIEAITVGETRAEDMMDFCMDGSKYEFMVGGWGQYNRSYHYTTDGYRINLYYNDDTHIIEKMNVHKLAFK